MLSINNVPFRDTQAFMDEVRLVVERDWERVTDALIMWDRLGLPDDEDGYASLVFGGPVRRPRMEEQRRRCVGGRKHKEVK